ncbi:putative Gnk2-like domain-containing protein [Lupinus albus]|uniref:Putative Gnk2-like domain-containing protein n=1 Tax=Lupinus albus TaxID=3870 RepID=A0A6A4NUN2_LUPAL|nr:putative Gnk2-like domain-containing protein [Lupinus albus]
MVIFKFFSLLLLAFSFFHYPTSGEDLMHGCSHSGNYTTNDPYYTNLEELFSYLTNEAPTNGFTMASKGEGENRTHGLALCRGDLSPTDCKNCVVHASNDILTFCPNNKGGIVMHENCTVRYSNHDFFDETMNNVLLCIQSSKNVNGSDPIIVIQFSQRIQDFLSKVTEEAVLNPKMYASGKSEIDEFHTAYGLAQCSRDLSRLACNKCLTQSVAFVAHPDCGEGKEGVKVYSEICRVRYELKPFVNDKHIPLPPTSYDAISPQPQPVASSHCLDASVVIVVMGFLSQLLSYNS